jgi:putative DNA primase/helicase
MPPSPGQLQTDDAIVARLERGRNNREMAVLWRGDSSGYASISAGDLVLCEYLALCTDGDAARIDGLFRRSRRYRGEWDEVPLDHSANGSSATYGALTIARAIEAWEERTHAIERTLALSPANVEDTFNQTDTGNAEYFAARWGHAVRRDWARDAWFVFADQHWSPNQTGDVERLALEAIRQQ